MSKEVIITGASGEIGFAAAKKFASEGFNLYLTGFNNYEGLCNDSEALSDLYKAKIKTYKCDVADFSQVNRVCNQILTEAGSLDLLINNAGMSVVGLDQDMKEEEWLRLCNTNLSSVMYFCRNVIPTMVKTGKGRIINISSMWGVQGASCEAAYSATKGGINAYTKALGKELAPSEIPVNAIAFGAIDTKMNGHLSEDEKKMLCEEIPFGRMASAEEAAEMIYNVYCAPKYMTAQIIGFDGGY